MRTVYLDCRAGVSGDMVLHALRDLTDDPDRTQKQIEEIRDRVEAVSEKETEDHKEQHHFHRSYRRVQEILKAAAPSEETSVKAESIYAVIAAAESTVHGESLEDLHFHEVGRDQAIVNVLGAALCAENCGMDKLICSEICDGQGTVECAHGTLTVPVPAVQAMLQQCSLEYRQTEFEGEMVTPSGLAMIIGLGAVCGTRPGGPALRCAEARGRRNFGEHGLRAMLFETGV